MQGFHAPSVQTCHGLTYVQHIPRIIYTIRTLLLFNGASQYQRYPPLLLFCYRSSQMPAKHTRVYMINTSGEYITNRQYIITNTKIILKKFMHILWDIACWLNIVIQYGLSICKNKLGHVITCRVTFQWSHVVINCIHSNNFTRFLSVYTIVIP